jgi:hypothetical protein
MIIRMTRRSKRSIINVCGHLGLCCEHNGDEAWDNGWLWAKWVVEMKVYLSP